ncbi:MAG: TolC family protein [Niabella sp.]
MKHIILFFCSALWTGVFSVSAQQTHLLLKVDSLFSLAERNSKQLDITHYKIGMRQNATAIEKQEAYLPEFNTSFTGAYMSNAHVWDNRFNYESTVLMPHTSIDFSVAAGYVVFNGNASKNKIAKARLEEQIANLDYQKDKENIQFLLLAKYLDLFALRNQENVYLQNIALADKRLSNIEKLIQQGMLTHNDQVRSQLQLTDFQLKLKEVRNNISIINHDLNTVLSLPENTVIEVDTLLYTKAPGAGEIDSYADGFADRLPELKIAEVHTQAAGKQVAITKAGRLPSVSLFTGDAISRPFLYATPPIDIYMHVLQVGFKVKYNISSLYTSKKQIQQAEMEQTLSQKNEEWLRQKAEMDIHEADVKLRDAWDKYHSQEESFRLARDNYRVVEQKYLNKFAVITDMLDASTSLLAAQINVNNARIGIIYQYYHLLKTCGRWEEAGK